MLIKPPQRSFKVFAYKAKHSNYLPARFAQAKRVEPDEYSLIANRNYEFGLESLEGDLQLRDLNSLFLYMTSTIGHLYQQGIAEWNVFQHYTTGSLVQYKNKIYVCIKEHKPVVEPEETEKDACCNPCGLPYDEPEIDYSVKKEPSIDTDYWEDITQGLQDIVAELDSRVEKYYNELTNKVAVLRDDLTNLTNTVETNKKEVNDRIDKEVKNLTTYVDTQDKKLQNNTDSLTTKYNDLEARYGKTVEKLNEVKIKLNTLIYEIQSHDLITIKPNGDYVITDFKGNAVTIPAHKGTVQFRDATGKAVEVYAHKTINM